MAYRRPTSPEPAPTAAELTARMVGIGMNFAAKAQANADIERTLMHASVLGMDDGDLRVLAVLTTWLRAHHTHVNADRLVRLVGAHPSERERGLGRRRDLAIDRASRSHQQAAHLRRGHGRGPVDR
jgi:hypothetical protein